MSTSASRCDRSGLSEVPHCRIYSPFSYADARAASHNACHDKWSQQPACNRVNEVVIFDTPHARGCMPALGTERLPKPLRDLLGGLSLTPNDDACTRKPRVLKQRNRWSDAAALAAFLWVISLP
jgi:hypothetical protein